MARYFGTFGGQYVGEVLKPALFELERAMTEILPGSEFRREYSHLLRSYAGRPTPLCRADNLTRELGGAEIYIKLEGLAQTGAHKINNALGQVLLAKLMGKQRVIAETGAGQHGVAVAASAAKLGLECEVFMGSADIERQQPNVFLMKQFGAEVHPVEDGSKTLKDAVNAALKCWIEESSRTFYVLGSALGPYPYPDLVREFQQIIGIETKQQLSDMTGRLPDTVIACCGGGSNAVGMFSAFLDDPVRLIAVEAGGTGDKPGEHAVRMGKDRTMGIIEGYKSYFLQDPDGQVQLTHSISAGLDYAGIGPELAYLGDAGRIEFARATDSDVLEAYSRFASREGLLCALESAHAASEVLKQAPQMEKGSILVMNMSGRGDKDIFITAGRLYPEEWKQYLLREAAK